jgi:hypothetical protein
MSERSKAFFLNGGAGRMLCSIPALEKYEEESGDKDFVIVCEGGTDMFKGHPTLHERAYDPWHKNLFKDVIKHRQVVNPEPYQVWEYYNQECSISQAFDIILNNKGVRDLHKPTLNLSKDELLTGRQLIGEVQEKLKVEKVVVFQPFGRGVQVVDDTPVDQTARSFEFKDIKAIVKKLQEKGYGIVIMSEMKIDFKGENLKSEIAMPEGLDLRQWSAVIKYADHFLGCDSVGQHLAYAVDTPITCVTGSTYPVNVSYPNTENVNVLDIGQNDREYSPIRITMDERVDRHNENLMAMDEKIQDYVVGVVSGEVEHEE